MQQAQRSLKTLAALAIAACNAACSAPADATEGGTNDAEPAADSGAMSLDSSSDVAAVVDSATSETTTTDADAGMPVPSCLGGSGPLITLSGAQTSFYDKRTLEPTTRIDARTASWSNLSWNNPVRASGSCWSGGNIKGLWDPLVTQWDTYHDTYAFTIFGNSQIVENLRVDNYGDAFNVRNDATTGNNFVIRAAHVTNNHDDCVQNDSMKAGTIEDSLFDGCYVFFSARDYGDGPTNVVTIKDNLVRMQAFPTYFGGSTMDPAQYQNGGVWKMDQPTKVPRLSIHHNVFRLDKESRGWIPAMPMKGIVTSCSDNIIVWLGTGPFPGDMSELSHCFTVTTDVAVWNTAVANWKTRHPG